jgi:hypothetical protein
MTNDEMINVIRGLSSSFVIRHSCFVIVARVRILDFSQTAKLINEEAKKQGIIVDYEVLLGDASEPHAYNILIMQEVKNFAAYDGIREKIDAIEKKVVGTEDQQRQLAIKRVEVREILGTKRMREITLK